MKFKRTFDESRCDCILVELLVGDQLEFPASDPNDLNFFFMSLLLDFMNRC